jgi:hypothetical protein
MICVPIMLIVKPVIIFRRNHAKTKRLKTNIVKKEDEEERGLIKSKKK